MKKIHKHILIVLASILLPVKVFAGPAYPACIVACEAACITAAVLTAGAAAPCIAGCPFLCVLSCFSSETEFTVLENGTEINRNVSLIKAGDYVKTLHNGKVAWTRVLKNVKANGLFEFVQIEAKNEANGECRKLTLTPNHGVIIKNDRLTLDAAENLTIADKLIDANYDTLSVTAINKVTMKDKYTLETSYGTVLASGFFVSTICTEEIAGGERLLDDKINDWRVRHINISYVP